MDTGSPVTLIGTSDVKRARLSKIQLQKIGGMHKPVNIGGGKIFTVKLESAKLKFGETEIDIPVDFPISGDENALQPSLLGIDFMLKTKSKFFLDVSKKEAYFEID